MSQKSVQPRIDVDLQSKIRNMHMKKFKSNKITPMSDLMPSERMLIESSADKQERDSLQDKDLKLRQLSDEDLQANKVNKPTDFPPIGSNSNIRFDIKELNLDGDPGKLMSRNTSLQEFGYNSPLETKSKNSANWNPP